MERFFYPIHVAGKTLTIGTTQHTLTGGPFFMVPNGEPWSFWSYLETLIGGGVAVDAEASPSQTTNPNARAFDLSASIQIGDLSDTFDLSLLGLPPEGWNFSTASAPFSYGGTWSAYKPANSAFLNEIAEQYTNQGRGLVRQVTRWGVDRIRFFEYSRIPAIFVRPGRSLLSEFAAIGQVAVGDSGNVFRDFWAHGLSTHARFLVVYSDGTHEWAFSPRESAYAKELNRCLSWVDGGEFYDVSFALQIDTGTRRQG